MIATTYLAVDLVISYPAGHLIDRLNSSVLNLVASILMVAGFMLAFLGLGLSGIFLATIVAGSGLTIKGDSFSAIIRKHVSRSNTSKAISYNQGVVSVSSIVGIVMGGLSILVLKDYLFYLLVIFPAISAILAIPLNELRTDSKTGLVQETREVLSFIRKIAGFLIFGFVINGLFISLTVFSSGIFHIFLNVSAVYYTAFVLAVPVGMLLGSAIASLKLKKLERNSSIAFMVALYAPLLVVIGLNRIPDVDVLCAFLIGLLVPIINVPLNAKLFNVIPREIFGKSMSILRISISGSTPIMASVFAVLALFFPINLILVAAGLITIPFSLFGFRVISSLMGMEDADESSAAESPTQPENA